MKTWEYLEIFGNIFMSVRIIDPSFKQKKKMIHLLVH